MSGDQGLAYFATDTLDIVYRDQGPRDGTVVVLLHGWPDDASTWEHVKGRLNEAGLRTIVPTLRGFGATRFRDDASPRTGNSAIHAMDVVALLDGLEIDRFMVDQVGGPCQPNSPTKRGSDARYCG